MKKIQHQLYHQKNLFNKMSWIGRSISFPYIYLRVYLHLGGALVIHSRGCGDVSIALYCAIASINWCAHYLCALVSMLFAQHLLLSIRLFWLGTVRSAWKSYVCISVCQLTIIHCYIFFIPCISFTCNAIIKTHKNEINKFFIDFCI